MSATPRPWWIHVAVPEGYELRAMNGPVTVCPAIAHGSDDADLIVRAVNNFDLMREALEQIASGAVKEAAIAASGLRHEDPSASARITKLRARLFFAQDVEEVARAALAAARGEPS